MLGLGKARGAAVAGLIVISAAAGPICARAATVVAEVHVDVRPAFAWSAVRDVGGAHRRLARGFVLNSVVRNGVRTITFAEGVTPRVVKERIVGIDDRNMRIAYGAIGTQAVFHAASLQVLPEGSGCKLVWITDVLPDSFVKMIRHNMELGIAAMKRTLEEDAKAGMSR